MLNFLSFIICSLNRSDRVERLDHSRVSEHSMTCKRTFGGILHAKSLRMLKERKAICYPFFFIVHNTKPVGHQVVKLLVV